ncbi:hypothetical protein DICA0_E08636 [Diutina catenulata]
MSPGYGHFEYHHCCFRAGKRGSPGINSGLLRRDCPPVPMKFSTALVTATAIVSVSAAPIAQPAAEPILYVIPWALNLVGNLGHGLANTLGGILGYGPMGPVPPPPPPAPRP